MGPAGEAVLHGSLRDAAPAAGYRLLNPDGGEVREVLGHEVAEGPVDSAAFFHPTDDRGAPSGEAVLLMIEVKNVRHWLYPGAEEIYQVLHKAAAMQQREPHHLILPVLVARRHHYLTWTMAKDLGLFLIDTRRQYMLPSRFNEQHIAEVKDELGLTFLTPTTEADEELTDRLTRSLPSWAVTNARKWQTVGSRFTDHYDILRRSLPNDARASAFYELRDAARDGAGCSGTWTGEGLP